MTDGAPRSDPQDYPRRYVAPESIIVNLLQAVEPPQAVNDHSSVKTLTGTLLAVLFVLVVLVHYRRQRRWMLLALAGTSSVVAAVFAYSWVQYDLSTFQYPLPFHLLGAASWLPFAVVLFLAERK